MAAQRRGQEPIRLDVPKAAPPPSTTDLPCISALFLIRFDAVKGYAIRWKRALPGLELEGGVEYKCMPSGLHSVNEDLVYFVHGRHAGLNAFVSVPAADEARGALMIAVGVLVPLSYGRLGRSWKHAENLKAFAGKLAVESPDMMVLEEYWNAHRLQDSKGLQRSESLDSPSSLVFKPVYNEPSKPPWHARNRSASDGTALIPAGHSLSPHHPAWSLTALLDAFGPLTFPIYRSALLRKRILLTCHAPVQQTCDFVYDLSVLSNIPLAVSNLISSTAPSQRLRPLFNVGVHDIPFLEQDLQASLRPRAAAGDDSDEDEDLGRGWIASTTDSILSVKEKLFDMIITMPQPHSQDAREKVWPEVRLPGGTQIKATQRDLRRYRNLMWNLGRTSTASQSAAPESNEGGGRLRRSNTTLVDALVQESPMSSLPDTDAIVEPQSWAALAYTGFLWWASAGEGSIALNDETDHDNSLLDGLALEPQTPSASRQGGAGAASATKELAIIAYFHRLTNAILTTLSDIVEAADSDDDEDTPLRLGGRLSEEELSTISITGADMTRMGLDEWSANDRAFVEEMMEAYFDRRAKFDSHNIDVCGVRVC